MTRHLRQILAPRRRAALARVAFAWSAGWVAAGAFYLLLIDTTELPELLVGAGAAILAASGMELAREQDTPGEAVRLRWLARLHRSVLDIPRDIVTVSVIALRAVVDRRASQGAFRAIPFTRVGEAAERSGRLALAEAAGSLAPNTVVVGIDDERKLILAHQLRPTAGRAAIDPLGLGEDT